MEIYNEAKFLLWDFFLFVCFRCCCYFVKKRRFEAKIGWPWWSQGSFRTWLILWFCGSACSVTWYLISDVLECCIIGWRVRLLCLGGDLDYCNSRQISSQGCSNSWVLSPNYRLGYGMCSKDRKAKWVEREGGIMGPGLRTDTHKEGHGPGALP